MIFSIIGTILFFVLGELIDFWKEIKHMTEIEYLRMITFLLAFNLVYQFYKEIRYAIERMVKKQQ